MRFLVDYAQWTYLSEYAPVYVDFDADQVNPWGDRLSAAVATVPRRAVGPCNRRLFQ